MVFEFYFLKKKGLDEKGKSKKKKTKYILDRSVDHIENKDSLKFKIHLQKSESQFEEGYHSPEE